MSRLPTPSAPVRLRVRAAFAALLLAALVATVAAPLPESAEAGWRGKCVSYMPTPFSAKAVCDGNGPESYRIRAYCALSGWKYGPWRWYGDQRGSTVSCGWLNVWQYGIDHTL